MQAVCASLRAVAGRLCLSGITQAPSGSILQSPRSMIRNPFRHKWRYGLKTNSHGSNSIRHAPLSRATEAKMPDQTMQRTAECPYAWSESEQTSLLIDSLASRSFTFQASRLCRSFPNSSIRAVADLGSR